MLKKVSFLSSGALSAALLLGGAAQAQQAGGALSSNTSAREEKTEEQTNVGLSSVSLTAQSVTAPSSLAPSSGPPQQEAVAAENAQDIVVTTQRRSERLLDVPVSVSHVSAATLENVGITDITNIKIAVPGANVRNSAGFMQPYIRGVGSSAKTPLNEAPIATYVDDVYYASLNSVLSFNNIESIEVIKGPQGTLFGRNATGGLFNIRTRDPSLVPTGGFHIGYGNYQTVSGDAYISGGLSKTIAADLAFYGSHQGKGFGTNLTTGKEVYKNNRNLALRSKILVAPDNATRVLIIGDYATQKHSMGNATNYYPGSDVAPSVPAPILSNHPYDSFDTVQPQRSPSALCSTRFSLQTATAFEPSTSLRYLNTTSPPI